MIWVGDIDESFLRALMAESSDLVLASSGGDTDLMGAALDRIESIELFRTYATGKCYSAAVPIVAAGLKGRRFCSPRTLFMVHRPSAHLPPDSYSIDELELHKAELDRADKMYFDALAKHTKVSAKKWGDLCDGKDYYFDAAQAVKHGVVDSVESA